MLLFSIQAFANMTMNVRQELCAVMVFAVVDKAGSTVMENEEEVCTVHIQEIDYEAKQEKKTRVAGIPQTLRGELHVLLMSFVIQLREAL